MIKDRYFNESMGVRNERTNEFKHGYEVADKGGYKIQKRGAKSTALKKRMSGTYEKNK